MNSKHQEQTILDVGEWEQKFQELMQEVKPRHRWTLKFDETLKPDCVAQGRKQYQQKAFGRFQCSSCRRRWASAKVQVLCHMYLEPRQSQGHVLMRLFAQRCQKCYGAQFEKPEFSIDSAMRILNNLVYRIRERCYGNGIRKFSEIPVIPELPLEGSHDMANCEACALGCCVLSSQDCMTKPSNSSFSYMEIGSFDDIFSQAQAMNQSAKAKEAQRSGDSYEHKRSGPSHATAGTQVLGASSQPKRETSRQPTPGSDQQAARRTGSQPIQVSGSLPSGWTTLQPTGAAGSLSSQGANSQSALGTGPQTPQKTYSQAVRQVSQQSKQETVSQATQGPGLQATKKIDVQPTQRVTPTATHGSGTFNGTQGVYRRQESYSPRGSAPDSFYRSSTKTPPNDSFGINNLFKWGCDRVADLWNFVASKYF
ncbi:receptor-transporting protein 4 [Myotis daubentonii]|uniref:receptor-transporting protein 4 n=1 Tax=Myotis daubentonii TaxID=98922 RepID=UPI002873A562|nr:receptor-transporting protein 4 [Myotis daubentonii]XP_059543319.1 receptor-transporting protein 4 [Myotis daubentonii]XP_059543320.1 receptor-transporting protein 4 [Myotis daubentonii]XP_059543321.1 receptor-transporting protein 4 [Myotis daubentonii]XP_059543322.1 receptor-transporting protein 4 [Myotis daubentonii]XP_059543323.1 receptor-transporting protein 4 [Myotis daubentonii]